MTSVKAGDWQVFAIAVLLILGCFYGLYFAPGISADQRGGLFGLLGLVASYFLQRHAAEAAAVKTVELNNAVIKANGGKP